jgi:hypothetical protein
VADLTELVMQEERLSHCVELVELYGNPATRNRVPERVRSYRFIENLFETYTDQLQHAQLITTAGLVSRERLAEVTRITALARAARILLHANNQEPPRIPSLRPTPEEEEKEPAAAAPAAAAPNAEKKKTKKKEKKKTAPGENDVGGPFLLSAPPPLHSPHEAWMQQAVSGIATLARDYGLV